MKLKIRIYFFCFIFSCTKILLAQDSTKTTSDTLVFSGQVSLVGNYNFDNFLPLQIRGRYIPTLEYDIQLPNNKLIDFETAANIYGSTFFCLFDTINMKGDIQPYRAWVRYSTPQFEFRVGLQKIDFGSATLLCPL